MCLWYPSCLYGQTRKGYITSNSSNAQCRQYFRDNILLLDQIEGIYNVQSQKKGANAFRTFPPINETATILSKER